MNKGHIPTCIYSNKNERKLFRLYIGTYYVSIIGHAIMPEGKKTWVQVVKIGQNLPPLVVIGLTDMPKIWGPLGSGIIDVCRKSTKLLMYLS